MGVRVTYEDLVTLLEQSGLPVVPPGVTGVALPHVAIEPTAISILPGLRVGFEDTNIVIRYPLNANDVSTFNDLNTTTYGVLRALLGPVRAEEGCQATGLLRDADGTFGLTWVEEWNGVNDFKLHLGGSTFRRIVAVMELAAVKPEFEIDDVSSRRGFELVAQLLVELQANDSLDRGP